MKNTYLCAAIFIVFSSLALAATAQEETTESSTVENSERVQRIQELRQELRQEMQAERQSRRENIEQRLANLSEDERAALRERRRMVQQNQAQRAQRISRMRQERCDCSADGAENESED